jgi:hypothetical protein
MDYKNKYLKYKKKYCDLNIKIGSSSVLNSYLNNINILSNINEDKLKNHIILKSFAKRKVLNFIDDFIKQINNIIGWQEKSYLESNWINCEKQCNLIVKKFIKREINSTAYVLRTLGKSLLSTDKNKIFTVKFNSIYKGNISGIWNIDKRYFTIEMFQNNYNKGKLIMGFGPSASGKTYWAHNIIEIFTKINSTEFPTDFLSIDGGTYRESSVIYTNLVLNLLNKNIAGFKNLVKAGFSLSSSLFESGKIKKIIIEFLKMQKVKPNLYVPETLGGCVKMTCYNKYNKYIKLTNDDQWIGLCIWQHIDDTKCNYSKEYKCVGCTESGKKREMYEGKKYSSSAWQNSYNNGISISEIASGGWFHIHNTGGRQYIDDNNELKYCKSIIKIGNINHFDLNILNDIESEYNCKFVDNNTSNFYIK